MLDWPLSTSFAQRTATWIGHIGELTTKTIFGNPESTLNETTHEAEEVYPQKIAKHVLVLQNEQIVREDRI